MKNIASNLKLLIRGVRDGEASWDESLGRPNEKSRVSSQPQSSFLKPIFGTSHPRAWPLFRSIFQSIFSRIDEYSHFANNLKSYVYSSTRQTYPFSCAAPLSSRASTTVYPVLKEYYSAYKTSHDNINDLYSTTNSYSSCTISSISQFDLRPRFKENDKSKLVALVALKSHVTHQNIIEKCNIPNIIEIESCVYPNSGRQYLGRKGRKRMRRKHSWTVPQHWFPSCMLSFPPQRTIPSLASAPGWPGRFKDAWGWSEFIKDCNFWQMSVFRWQMSVY
jgi:hypothetical protein